MEDVVVRDPLVSRVSWRGIWAGLFMVAGVEILMQLFGIAIGVSALNPSRGAMEGVGIWTGIWAIVSTLSAYFFGGWVASSFCAPARRSDGVLASSVVWAFATTVGIMLLSAGAFGAIGVGRALMVPPGSPAAGETGIAALHSGYTIGAAWATFGTLLLALVCCILGGLVGIGGERRTRVVERPAGAPLSPREV